MAIENFRATIKIELADMYPQHKHWPKNINHYLTARLPEMYQNFEVFRVFIPQKNLLEYNTDWNNFRDFCRNITDEKIAAAEQNAMHPIHPLNTNRIQRSFSSTRNQITETY